MSASPSSPNQPTPNQTPGSAGDEQARKSQAAAMERFAEVSLKSVPLPEGVDPNKRATVGEAFKTIKSEDILKVHQAPCSRDGFITGIGSGAAVGFLRYIVGGEGSLLSCVVHGAGSANISVTRSSSAEVRELGGRIRRGYKYPGVRVLPVPKTGRTGQYEAGCRGSQQETG